MKIVYFVKKWYVSGEFEWIQGKPAVKNKSKKEARKTHIIPSFKNTWMNIRTLQRVYIGQARGFVLCLDKTNSVVYDKLAANWDVKHLLSFR